MGFFSRKNREAELVDLLNEAHGSTASALKLYDQMLENFVRASMQREQYRDLLKESQRQTRKAQDDLERAIDGWEESRRQVDQAIEMVKGLLAERGAA